jgi:hypothetical protein
MWDYQFQECVDNRIWIYAGTNEIMKIVIARIVV